MKRNVIMENEPTNVCINVNWIQLSIESSNT